MCSRGNVTGSQLPLPSWGKGTVLGSKVLGKENGTYMLSGTTLSAAGEKRAWVLKRASDHRTNSVLEDGKTF